MIKFTRIHLATAGWILVLMWLILLSQGQATSQSRQGENNKYVIGEKQQLEMIVHIWGEVKKPGEYRVADDTDILGLISKAGGPTEYSNMSRVILTRERTLPEKAALTPQALSSERANDALSGIQQAKNKTKQQRIIFINLKKYLESNDVAPLPRLQPGDIIQIKHNNWFRCKEALRIATQFAIVVQAYYYFTRID